MKRFIAVALLLAAVFALEQHGSFEFGQARPTAAPAPTSAASADSLLQRAFEQRLSDIVVEGHGTVIRVLPDDRDGSRHQRFVLRLASGQTLLVAHNIDLAPRVERLRAGDAVSFSGEYEWNERGGVIHWTHHDPAGRRPGGWLEHGGRRYR